MKRVFASKRMSLVWLSLATVGAIWLWHSGMEPATSHNEHSKSARLIATHTDSATNAHEQKKKHAALGAPVKSETIPDLELACTEIQQLKALTTFDAKRFTWGWKHYPQEMVLAERLFALPKFRTEYGPQELGVISPGYDVFDEQTLKSLASRGDMQALGLLGARVAVQGGPERTWDDRHLSTLKAAEANLREAISRGEPDLWSYYADIKMWISVWHDVQMKRSKQKELSKYAYDLWYEDFVTNKRSMRDIERNAVYRFAQGHHGVFEEVLSDGYKGWLLTGRPEDDAEIEPRVNLLKEAFSDAKLYSMSEAEKNEAKQLKESKNRMESVMNKIHVACNADKKKGSNP